jgi:hypothetical protein
LGSGKKEVEFYNAIAGSMNYPPSVHCYDAVYSTESHRPYILLDDLSDTRFQVVSSQLTSRQGFERIISCPALFHAFWWDHPRLGRDIGELPTEDSLRDYSLKVEGILPGFIKSVGDQITPEIRGFLNKAVSSLSDLWENPSQRKRLTLTHGDAHLKNFLYPRNIDKDKVRVVDWEFWNVGPGVNDLAFMIALHWPANQRRIMERTLINGYHDKLL